MCYVAYLGKQKCSILSLFFTLCTKHHLTLIQIWLLNAQRNGKCRLVSDLITKVVETVQFTMILISCHLIAQMHMFKTFRLK